MQVPHQATAHVLNTADLRLALMDVQPQSRSGEHFIKMLGQVSKQYTPIAKTVLKSPKWVQCRVAQQEVEQIRTQVGQNPLDWMRISACLVSYKTMPDVVNDLTAIIMRQFGNYGVAYSCTGLSRENNLAVIESLVAILAAHPHDYNVHANVLQIIELLYILRQHEGVDAADRLKAHMAVAIRLLTRSDTYDWCLVNALGLIMAIHQVSSTTLGELAESSDIDLLRLFLDIRLRHHDMPSITVQCTELSDILVSIPYVRTAYPTAADLILGYMKEIPGEQEIHDAECRRLDVLLKSRAGAITLAPDNLLFASDLIQDQQMNMNGPGYNSQEYVLWKLVEACIDMETPANVPQCWYDTLQSCFPMDFLLRTLVCHTSAPTPGSQPLQTSETISRVCKLIRFQTQYVSDSPCALSSRQRFLERNGISVFMDVVHQIPTDDVSLLHISILSTCINTLLRIFAENEAAVGTTLAIPTPHTLAPLREFAYGERKESRSTTSLSSFLIDGLIHRKVAGKHVADGMYIRYVRDTVHLLWVLVKCSCHYRQKVQYPLHRIAEKVCSVFCHWHGSMDTTDGCVFEQEDEVLCMAQLVWYFDDLVGKVALDENMNVWFMDGAVEHLEEYMEHTRQFRMMSSKLYYVMGKARHPALEIPPLYHEPSFPPTRDSMPSFPV